VDWARGDNNSAISGLSESLGISGFDKTYSLFKVCGVKGNIFWFCVAGSRTVWLFVFMAIF